MKRRCQRTKSWERSRYLRYGFAAAPDESAAKVGGVAVLTLNFAVPVRRGEEFDGEWRSLVAHLSGGQVVGGSNPLSPTNPLEKDEGLGRVLSRAETQGNLTISVPSSSAVFRYLSKFHDEEEETNEPHRAFIPSGTEALDGLKRVRRDGGLRAKPYSAYRCNAWTLRWLRRTSRRRSTATRSTRRISR